MSTFLVHGIPLWNFLYINISSSGVFMLSMIWVMVGTFGLLGRTYFFKVFFVNFYWSSISHGTNPNNGVEPTLIWLSISFLFYRSNRHKRCHSCSLPLSCDRSSPSFSSLIFLMTFVRLNYDLNADFSTYIRLYGPADIFWIDIAESVTKELLLDLCTDNLWDIVSLVPTGSGVIFRWPFMNCT